jgi:hypothetical protein
MWPNVETEQSTASKSIERFYGLKNDRFIIITIIMVHLLLNNTCLVMCSRSGYDAIDAFSVGADLCVETVRSSILLVFCCTGG